MYRLQGKCNSGMSNSTQKGEPKREAQYPAGAGTVCARLYMYRRLFNFSRRRFSIFGAKNNYEKRGSLSYELRVRRCRYPRRGAESSWLSVGRCRSYAAPQRRVRLWLCTSEGGRVGGGMGVEDQLNMASMVGCGARRMRVAREASWAWDRASGIRDSGPVQETGRHKRSAYISSC